MRIKHIYITKEGEPMANPEMEYPDPNKIYPASWNHGYQSELDKYHSGLLPFEDAKQVKLILASTRFTFPVWLANIIPADLEVGVVEYRVLDELDKLYDIRKVLRVKP